jgi:hypothetical protein
MKRKAENPPTSPRTGFVRRVNARLGATSLARQLRQNITTQEQLQHYINIYDQIEPYISSDQQHYLMTQFARHEYNLERGPSTQERTAQQVSRNVSLSRPVSINEADPFALEPPTGAGNVNRARERMTAEEEIDWSEFDLDEGPPSNPPPPPPPPAAGGGSISI